MDRGRPAVGAEPAISIRGLEKRYGQTEVLHGIDLETCELPAELTVWELVERFAGYHPRPRPVGETLELVGLGGSSRKSSSSRRAVRHA